MSTMKVYECLHHLLPPKERWIITAILVLCKLKSEGVDIVSAISLRKEMAKRTGLPPAGTDRPPTFPPIYDFLERLVELRLCSRSKDLENSGSKKVRLTETIDKLHKILQMDLDSIV